MLILMSFLWDHGRYFYLNRGIYTYILQKLVYISLAFLIMLFFLTTRLDRQNLLITCSLNLDFIKLLLSLNKRLAYLSPNDSFCLIVINWLIYIVTLQTQSKTGSWLYFDLVMRRITTTLALFIAEGTVLALWKFVCGLLEKIRKNNFIL